MFMTPLCTMFIFQLLSRGRCAQPWLLNYFVGSWDTLKWNIATGLVRVVGWAVRGVVFYL